MRANGLKILGMKPLETSKTFRVQTWKYLKYFFDVRAFKVYLLSLTGTKEQNCFESKKFVNSPIYWSPQSCRKYLLLTKLFDEIEAECLCFAFFIDIGDSSHQWTQNDLGMIFEEINLKSKSIGNQFLVFQLLNDTPDFLSW